MRSADVKSWPLLQLNDVKTCVLNYGGIEMPSPCYNPPNVASSMGEKQGLTERVDDRYRDELRAVLASEGFRRSPKLSRLLSYVCERYLEGRSDEVTEFSIALDVLNRDNNFDPQQDAVVRVDIYHLRKRLKQYYEGDGRHDEIVIEIPTGRYTPQFLARNELTDPASKQSPTKDGGKAASRATVPDIEGPKRSLHRWIWYGGIVALAAIAIGFAGIGAWRKAIRGAEVFGASRSAEPSPGSVQSARDELRIAAGSSKDYVDRSGRTWLADRYFNGGTTFYRAGLQILRTHEPDLFRSGREGQFVYDIPLRPGVYELHLYFAETGVESEALRSVSIAINGRPVASLDVASDAGGIDTATEKIYKDISPSTDGFVHIMFHGSEPSFLNAIEIVPGMAGKMRPIRLAASDSVFRDHAGQEWLPDSCAIGGRKSTRAVIVSGTADPGLYQWARFGHFNYSIPVVPDGRFTLILHFSETWFNGSGSKGGVGSRVFNVYCNGKTLLENFDILEAAGGVSNHALDRIFHNIPASPLGKLDVTFVPVANYAIINALEVIQE